MRTIKLFYIYLLSAIDPEKLPARLNMELFKSLQENVAATIFTAPASYDGRKNVFSMYKLQLGPTNSREVRVPTCTNYILHTTFFSSSLMFLSLAKARRLLLGVVLPRYTKWSWLWSRKSIPSTISSSWPVINYLTLPLGYCIAS